MSAKLHQKDTGHGHEVDPEREVAEKLRRRLALDVLLTFVSRKEMVPTNLDGTRFRTTPFVGASRIPNRLWETNRRERGTSVQHAGNGPRGPPWTPEIGPWRVTLGSRLGAETI